MLNLPIKRRFFPERARSLEPRGMRSDYIRTLDAPNRGFDLSALHPPPPPVCYDISARLQVLHDQLTQQLYNGSVKICMRTVHRPKHSHIAFRVYIQRALSYVRDPVFIIILTFDISIKQKNKKTKTQKIVRNYTRRV